MRLLLQKIWLGAWLLLLFNTVAAQKNIPPRPNPPRLVNDFVGILSPDQKADLEQRLVAFDDSTSTQIAVVIMENTQGYEVSEYAVDLGRQWGVGGKEWNNGVVLLITTEKGNRKVFIATGYGAEGALPDITCKHIVDDIIIPRFRGQDFYGGISSGVTTMMKALQGEYKAPKGYKKRGRGLSTGNIVLIVIAIIIFLAISSGGGGRGGTFMSRRGHRGVDNIPPIWWFGGFGGGGGSGGGGGGGGGFGGFGGGSFGGGGAGGSWD
jgi:uncharacterized protein